MPLYRSWHEPSRRGAYVTSPRLAQRWTALVRRLATDSRQDRRTAACCPA